MVGEYITIGTPGIFGFPLIFPLVFVNKSEVEQLFNDAFPDSKQGDKNYIHNQKDVLQLYAHKVAQRDVFITNDKAILEKKDILAKNWGIIVKSLEDYLSEQQ
jgi:hypothetical protein